MYKDVVHVYNGKPLSCKKEQNHAICSYMDGPRDDHCEVSQRQKSYDITYMWDVKYETNKLIYETNSDSLRDIQYKFIVPKGKGRG